MNNSIKRFKAQNMCSTILEQMICVPKQKRYNTINKDIEKELFPVYDMPEPEMSHQLKEKQRIYEEETEFNYRNNNAY